MSIFEVTNLDTGDVKIVSVDHYSDLRNYAHRAKVAALDPAEDIQVVYYQDGYIYNEHGPAVIYHSGSKV